MTLERPQLRALAERLGLPRDAAWSQSSLGDRLEHRPVVRLDVGPERFVARRIEPREVAPRLSLMRELFDHSRAPLGIPEPLAALVSAGWIVERWVAARPVPQLVGRDDGARLARRIGRALSTLHRLPLQRAVSRTLADHVDELIHPHPARLLEALPARAGLIRRALALLSERSACWAELSVAPLHRDFHLRQLLADDRRIWIVDWESFAWGDPLFDVAYMTTYLETHLAPTEASCWREAFLEGYGAELTDHAVERLRVYRLFNHLRRACRRFRRRDTDWQRRLDASLHALELGLRESG